MLLDSTSHHYVLLVLYMYPSNKTGQLESHNVCTDVCIDAYLVDECSYK